MSVTVQNVAALIAHLSLNCLFCVIRPLFCFNPFKFLLLFYFYRFMCLAFHFVFSVICIVFRTYNSVFFSFCVQV